MKTELSNDLPDIYTGLWTVCFRKPGMSNGPEMNAISDAYGQTLAEAILYARQHMAKDAMFAWDSPVTKVTYAGKINLMTMELKQDRKLIYDEGLFD